MISAELSMIQMLNPIRNSLASDVEAFLKKGGAIEVLEDPSFQPPPERHEPPQRIKSKPAKRESAAKVYIDKITQRDIEREERAEQRVKEKAERIEYIRSLAETMTYASAILRTGLARRTLQTIATENGFKFQPADHQGRSNLQIKTIDEAKDIQDAERIRSFMEIGLSRHQAMSKVGLTYKTFVRILNKFEIDYPKRKAGPHPAFFEKKQR